MKMNKHKLIYKYDQHGKCLEQSPNSQVHYINIFKIRISITRWHKSLTITIALPAQNFSQVAYVFCLFFDKCNESYYNMIFVSPCNKMFNTFPKFLINLQYNQELLLMILALELQLTYFYLNFDTSRFAFHLQLSNVGPIHVSLQVMLCLYGKQFVETTTMIDG